MFLWLAEKLTKLNDKKVNIDYIYLSLQYHSLELI